MNARSELERARQAYEAGRAQRDGGNVQRAQDNARIDGANSAAASGQAGGAR